MTNPWTFVTNPFLTLGLKNFKKAVKISTYTDAALLASADPFYVAQYALYHPLHLAMVASYNAWKTQGGTQKGATATLDLMLRQLEFAKINQWDAGVQAVYAKATPQYIAIFPQGHKPFQTGTIDSRINAINSLSLAMTGIVPLAPVRADVVAFYTAINNARITQEGQKGTKAVDSHAVTTAVTTAMTGMYTFLGNCMSHFANNPKAFEFMFDLQTIRHHMQTFFTGHVKQLKVRTVCKRTFHRDVTIEIENIGNTELVFYRANTKDAPRPRTSVVVPPYQTVMTPLSALGELTSSYLIVFNTNAFLEGDYNINLDPEAMQAAA